MSATTPDLVLTRLIDAPRERGWKLDNLNTVVLADKDGKTELTVTVIVRKRSSEIAQALAGMQEGWSQSLERLALLAAA
jgi:uncharacterized protein YndB with AHSA1/START domain